MGDGPATRQLFFRPVLVDMDPLLVAGRLGKAVYAILISVPTAALNSLKSLKMRMSAFPQT